MAGPNTGNTVLAAALLVPLAVAATSGTAHAFCAVQGATTPANTPYNGGSVFSSCNFAEAVDWSVTQPAGGAYLYDLTIIGSGPAVPPVQQIDIPLYNANDVFDVQLPNGGVGWSDSVTTSLTGWNFSTGLAAKEAFVTPGALLEISSTGGGVSLNNNPISFSFESNFAPALAPYEVIPTAAFGPGIYFDPPSPNDPQVPEPSSLPLIGVGLLLLGALSRLGRAQQRG